MSSALYLQQVRSAENQHNPYYEFFRDSIGKGDNLYYVPGIDTFDGGIPTFKRGYGIIPRNDGQPGIRPLLGYGIGDWLSRIFRFAQPLLKRGLNEIAKPMVSHGLKEAADVAGKIASDTLKGVRFKDSFKKRASEKAGELIEKAPSAFSGLIRKSKGAGIKVRSLRSSVGASSRRNNTPVIFTKTKSKSKKRKKSNKSFPGLKLIG